MSKLSLAFRCVDLSMDDVPDLNDTTDRAREISFRTFARHTDWQDVAKSLGYTIGNHTYVTSRGDHGRLLTLGRDYHVSFYRSHWRGKPCYYMEHSAIEYVFLQEVRP